MTTEKVPRNDDSTDNRPKTTDDKKGWPLVVDGLWSAVVFLLLPLMPALQFQLQNTQDQSKARAGKITTDHGEIETPIFMPVGTAGSVKAVTQQQLYTDVKAQIILGNTYHLYLRPGIEILESCRRAA
ncbi:MAG: tRNA-guanine transglycosylase [Segetibacter sp.]